MDKTKTLYPQSDLVTIVTLVTQLTFPDKLRNLNHDHGGVTDSHRVTTDHLAMF